MKNLADLTKGLVPPRAERRAHKSRHHGRSRVDDYAWLEPRDWQGLLRGASTLEPDILDYLRAENSYTEAVLEPTADLQKTLVAEMRGRIQEDEQELPEKDGPYEYFWRYVNGAEHPRLARNALAGGAEQCLLDADFEAREQAFFELGDYEVSPDHQMLAWSCDRSGNELCELRFRCLRTGSDLPLVIHDVDTVTWLSTDTVIYVTVDAGNHANQVWRHRVGQGEQEPELVFCENDPAFEVAVGRLRSGHYVELVTASDGQDEIWLMATGEGTAEPWLFEPRFEGLEYSIDHQGDLFYILTNAFGATDFQIMTTGRNATRRANWQTWLPAREGVMLQSLDCYRDWVVWLEQQDALPQLCFANRARQTSRIEFAGVAYELDYAMSPQFDCQLLRFSFESPVTPLQTWEYDLQSHQRRLLKESVIPSGHEPSHYITQRLHARSSDGTKVPITCIYHRDTVIDGTALCVLEGYGSYGSSMPMGFDSQRLSLLERGVVYALAHVRGGAENGRSWYYAARGANKIRSVEDYLACIDCLVSGGHSRAAGVVGLGRSAGGLLIGAALNQAPRSFVGAIADVPFVDVLNTLLDETHPLTPGEWGQWGNPLASREAYQWIEEWSPYDNVAPQYYPALLVTTALSDPRVGFWEAAKWVARLRSTASPEPAILLRTDMQTGHSGNPGRFQALCAFALEYAFVLALDKSGQCGQTVCKEIAKR